MAQRNRGRAGGQLKLETCPWVIGTGVNCPIGLPFKSTKPTWASTGTPGGGVTGPATVRDPRMIEPVQRGMGGNDIASVMVKVAVG